MAEWLRFYERRSPNRTYFAPGFDGGFALNRVTVWYPRGQCVYAFLRASSVPFGPCRFGRRG